MTQTDVYFKVHTKQYPDPLVASWATNSISEINNVTRGETASFNLHFPGTGELGPLNIASGETHTIEANTVEYYTEVNQEENGTLDQEENGILVVITDTDGILADIEDYGDHAGAFATIETLGNAQKFREQFNASSADVNSILLGIEPSQKLKDRGINGIWGLVTSGTDNRTQALTNNQYQIELRVLAEFADYADRSAVETDLLV